METPEKANRQGAIRALINLAVLEGFVLMAVVGIYLYTNNLTHLVGGIVGTALIFGPMFFRWWREHGEALKPKANSAGEGRR